MVEFPMKKIVFILMATCCLLLARAESIVAHGAPIAEPAFASARDEAENRNRAEAEAGEHSPCREVDVSLDEGYGVSRHEKRLVCQEVH
jgi:hypothetical protein